MSQNETVKCTTSGTPSAWKRWTRPSHCERLPETPPFRLYLPGGEDAVGIGADREEGGIAEIEQAGETDDDIEAERQHGEGGGVGGGVEIAPIAVDQRKQEQEMPALRHDQRAAARSDSECARHQAPEAPPDCRFARRVSAHRAEPYDLRGTSAPEQPVRPEHQHQDQDREDDHVGPAHGDELAAERFDRARS